MISNPVQEEKSDSRWIVLQDHLLMPSIQMGLMHGQSTVEPYLDLIVSHLSTLHSSFCIIPCLFRDLFSTLTSCPLGMVC